MNHLRPQWLDAAERHLIQQGLTNRVYRLSHEGRFYFYRVSVSQSEQVFIHRRSEQQVLALMQTLGLTPAVLYFADDGSEMLMDWCIEPVWSQAQFSSLHGIQTVARLCAQIHRCSLPIHHLHLSDYLSSLTDHLSLPFELLKLHHEVLTWLKSLPSVSLVLCHNDINPSNVMGAKPWLLDWEYAALGDPAFDLAGIIRAGQMNQQQVGDLLEAYQQAGGLVDSARVEGMLKVVDLVGYYWCEHMKVQQPEQLANYEQYQQQIWQRLLSNSDN